MPITDELILQLNALTEEELLTLNKICITNLTAIRTRKMDTVRDALSLGDTVTFTGRERGRGGRRFPVTGTVSKIKRKRAEVKCFEKGLAWDVNIGCLTRVEVEIQKSGRRA